VASARWRTLVRLGALDSTSTATKIYVGLYADNGGHPGVLLSQGTSTQLTNGSWNVISTLGVPITSGTKYWIAILGTTTGTPFFRDRHNGPCKSETSQQTTLAALPATWITGTVYADCPISAYGNEVDLLPPVERPRTRSPSVHHSAQSADRRTRMASRSRAERSVVIVHAT
jgi:hypothetical protein